jgi:tRNA/rRNA methyltransferase
VTLHFAAVLVRPARAANVGAAARALKNFGWSDLRVVGAPDALPGGADHAEARALAWNAADVLEGARSVASLEEAVADLHLTAAATARVDHGGETLEPRAFGAEASALGGGARVGVVFGPETHGLSNEELDLCRVRLRIPSRGPQPSLNLAQSVVIVAYEAALAARAPEAGSPVEAATEGEMQRAAEAARRLLLRAGYLNPQAPEHLLGELRRLLARARPTGREVTLLLGLVAQLDWANRERPD